MKNRKHFIYKIYRKKTIARIDGKIKLLGVHCKYKTEELLCVRLFLSFLLFFLFFFFMKNGYFWAPIVTVCFYIFSEVYVLDYQIKKREKKLEREAIFFFEVLGLTIESGRNLKSALQLTTKNIDSELSLEFQKVLSDVKLGKSFVESLKDMKSSIPSDSIHNILLSLVQANVYGSNIVDSLHNQLDYLREKRLFDIKAEIAKLPTKISILSVLFFIPIMLLVILSPVIVEFFSK